jgi:hypothetical protein
MPQESIDQAESYLAICRVFQQPERRNANRRPFCGGTGLRRLEPVGKGGFKLWMAIATLQGPLYAGWRFDQFRKISSPWRLRRSGWQNNPKNHDTSD